LTPSKNFRLSTRNHGPRPAQDNIEKKASRCLVLTGGVTLSPDEHKNCPAPFSSWTLLCVLGQERSVIPKLAQQSCPATEGYASSRPGRFSELGVLMLGTKLGVQLNVDRLAAELASIWTSLSRKQYAPRFCGRALQQYLPIASRLPSSIAVREAFEKARPSCESNT